MSKIKVCSDSQHNMLALELILLQDREHLREGSILLNMECQDMAGTILYEMPRYGNKYKQNSNKTVGREL